MVAAIGSPWIGAVVLFSFAAGRAVPILFGASAVGWLQTMGPSGRLRRAFDIAAELTLVASGLYLMNAYFIVIPSLAL